MNNSKRRVYLKGYVLYYLREFNRQRVKVKSMNTETKLVKGIWSKNACTNKKIWNYYVYKSIENNNQ